MFRFSTALLGGRARAKAAAPAKRVRSTFFAVPAVRRAYQQRETAAQREFEQLINEARRQKKRQIQAALKAALKKQARISHDLTARQQRYALNKDKASKELRTIAAEKEKHARKLAQAAEQAKALAAAEASAAPKKHPRSHSNAGRKAVPVTSPKEVAQKRKAEEKQAEQFLSMLASLQRKRKEQVTAAIKSALQAAQAAKIAQAKEAALPQEADKASKESSQEAPEASGSAEGEPAEVKAKGRRAAAEGTGERRGKPTSGSKRPTTEEEASDVAGTSAPTATETAAATSTAAEAPAEEVAQATEGRKNKKTSKRAGSSSRKSSGEASPVAEVQTVVSKQPVEKEVGKGEAADVQTEQPAKVKKASSKRASRVAAAEPAPSSVAAADGVRTAYFDAVRKTVASGKKAPNVSEAARVAPPPRALVDSASTSNWPTPESSTGLFRL